MRRIVLFSCVKRKATSRCKAEHLYQSDLFKKCLEYARSLRADEILVLSAKHGLLRLDDEIGPYDETLNTMPIADVKTWADQVLVQLRRSCDLEADEFIFLASLRYRRFLLPCVVHHNVPMMGLKIGRQLRFLKEKVDPPSR